MPRLANLRTVGALLEVLRAWDHAAVAASQRLRWEPLTAVFVLLSAAWIKGPIIVACGAVADVRRRHVLPCGAVCGLTAVVLAAALVDLVKGLVDRVRPPLADPSITALVNVPDSASFPSGHTATAFAAAVAVGALHPRLRVPLIALAAFVGVSRVYLGVHFWVDVLAGAALGIAVGLAAAAAVRWLAALRTR